MKPELITDALSILPIQKHTKQQRKTTKLNGYFVDENKVDNQSKLDVEHGFIMFNSRFALVDKFD